MKLAIFAGPATTGKTSVLRHITRKLQDAREKVAFLKIDVQYAEEDEEFAREFGIPARKVYSGELCPDHCNVMVLGDAMKWARSSGCQILLVETAGLCLRCSPYVDGGLGAVVLEATSGMNMPLKVGPMLSLRARYVQSSKGKGGGYRLAKPASEISIAEVIRLFDGALAPTDSVSTYFYDHTPIEKEKKLIQLFKDLRDWIAAKLEATTLADMI